MTIRVRSKMKSKETSNDSVKYFALMLKGRYGSSRQFNNTHIEMVRSHFRMCVLLLLIGDGVPNANAFT